MHNEYISYIDDKYRLHLFYADERIDGVLYKTEYQFNYPDSVIHVEMTNVKDTSETIYKNVPLDDRILDGTSLIMFARAHAHTEEQDTLLSIYEAKIGKIAINFTSENDDVKLANDTKVSSHFVDGMILLKGIAGVTGPYKGWFSTDRQRVPLKAELKVFIGSVKVELESWKNWLGGHFQP
jgi:hypothetical protein